MNPLEALADQLQQLLSGELPTAVSQTVEAIINEGRQHYQPDWAAHMTPALDHNALLALVMAGLHHGNLLSAECYPQLQQAEAELLAMLCPLFGQAHGHFTHGATYANLEALWQARQRQPQRHVVYGSRACHYSVAKACDLLGLQFQPLACNQQDQLQLQALAEACAQQAPLAIVANAGTTAAGMIDAIDSIAELAAGQHSWLHIDAAWGGMLLFDCDKRALLGDIQRADSISFDPHKALQQPRPCGLLCYQQPLDSASTDTDYLQLPPKHRLAGSYGAELFLPLWLSWRRHGVQGFAEQIKQRLAEAALFAAYIQQHTRWFVSHSECGIVCFQPDEARFRELQNSSAFSQARLAERPVLRAVFANSSTRAQALINQLATVL